jgi:TatD DNase family protein
MNLYDAHNHLQDERFGGRQNDRVAEARAAGVVHMVVNGSCAEDWPQVAELARRFPDLVIPSFGLHPWYVPERKDDWREQLARWLDTTPGAVMGEIGLDRWKPDLPWDDQEEAFIFQLDEAATRNVPVSIHCLQAWGRLVELLEQFPRPACGFVLHSYGGSEELIDRLAPLGAYFSLPGYYAHDRKARQRDVFRHVPPDRLLIETDAPDQLLPPDRQSHPLSGPDGKPLNHPANLGAVYAFAAELLGQEPTALAALVEQNFLRLFGPARKKETT